MLTKLAVRYLTYKLRKDKGFWISYQSNIAMAIWNTYSEYHPINNDEELRDFCNKSANDFLNLWTRRWK